MKLSKIVIAAAVVAAGASSITTSAFAQAKEQFFPLLVYRTGPYAPNGTPWANGKQDYIKMINARDGGVNGVKLTFEECETGYATDKGVECYERLKTRPNIAAWNPLSVGIAYAMIDRITAARSPGRPIPHPRTGRPADFLFTAFAAHEKQAQHLMGEQLALPAYEQVLKAAHTFNLLDARGAISVTERAAYIGRIRNLARAVAASYLDSRARLGFPMAPAELRDEVLAKLAAEAAQ